MRVRALSVRQPYADLLVQGKKTMEVRSYQTRHRGPLLICSTARPVLDGHALGHAIGIVEVVGCRLMEPSDAAAACADYQPGAYVWIVEQGRAIEPFPVKGRQTQFEINHPSLSRAETSAPGLFEYD